MRDATRPAERPTRRLVTAGALGAFVVALTGCGIRLEDDAPRVPLIPTREPIEAEEALVRFLAAVQGAAVAPLVTTDLLAPLLPPLHARQATVLHDALRQRGVPEDDLPTATPSPSTPSPSTSPTPAATPSGATPTGATPSPSAAVPRRTVAEVESSILAAAAPGLAAADAELRPTLVAVLGQAHAAVALAASTPTAPTTTAPGTTPTPGTTAATTPTPASSPAASSAGLPEWTSPSALVPLISATRRATFLLEVAAARSPQAVRAAWLLDITALQALTADLEDAAGKAAPPPDLGQTLPRPVTTPAEATTLATEALSTLLAATGAELRTLTDADPDAAFGSVPGWLGTVAATAHRHGTRLTPFPGLA